MSSSAYRELVPTGMFISIDGVSTDPVFSKDQFEAKARSSGNNPYARIRQLFPSYRYVKDVKTSKKVVPTVILGHKYVSVANMSGLDACQCFTGPNDADGQSAPPTLDGGQVLDGCGKAGLNSDTIPCEPHPSEFPYDTAYCATVNNPNQPTGGCWTSLNPQSPGPVPRQQTDWSSRDIYPENETKTSQRIKDRWWKDAMPGVYAIRAGISFLFGSTVQYTSSDIFNKKLYRTQEGDGKTRFSETDLLKFAEVAMLNVSGTTINLYIMKKGDEDSYYVKTPQRDMCNDFGLNSTLSNTNWSHDTLTDELFQAVINGSNVTFASPGTAASWNLVGNQSVCMGNLHGMPSYSSGVCGPIPELEERSKDDTSTSNLVSCIFPPIELPVCGNPYYSEYNASKFVSTVRRPESYGKQFAHYCTPTDSSSGWSSSFESNPDPDLLECEGDTMTPIQRDEFCADGGSIGLRGKRIALDRPAKSVCNVATATCIAYAGDEVWTMERILEHANSVFESSSGGGGYRIVVVPVNVTIVRRIPLDAAFEDLSVANRFTYSGTEPKIPNVFPFKSDSIKAAGSIHLAETMCTAPGVNINAQPQTDDPLYPLYLTVESMRATEGVCHVGPGLGEIPCDPSDYCIPRLETQSGRVMADCVPESEVFPPIADASLDIQRPGISIEPADVFPGRKIKFGTLSGSPPATCVRITVRKQGFSIRDVDFDQTNCNGLEESLRNAIVYSGSSAQDSAIENVVIRGYPGAGVVYAGNQKDGDSPYLVVGNQEAGVQTTDALLSGLSFVVSGLNSGLGGIVAASARTFGTQIISQCISADKCSNIRGNPNSLCTSTSVCPHSACPYSRMTQGCVQNSSSCPSDCTFMLSEGGMLSCFVGRFGNESRNYSPVPNLVPSVQYGVGLLHNRDASQCLRSKPPISMTNCNIGDPAQQWFIEYVPDDNEYRINPAGRRYTCFGTMGEQFGIAPCDACDVSTEATLNECASTVRYEDVVFSSSAGIPSSATFVRVAYLTKDDGLGVAAYPNGSCQLKSGGIWPECRTECIKVPQSTCNVTSFTAGLLFACGYSGSLAAIQSIGCTDSSTVYPVIQSSNVQINATARCDGGKYVLVSHGLGYESGQASVDENSIQVWVSTAIIQPFDELAAIAGTGVSVFNLTALTGLFDRTFEARLTGADKTTTWYLMGAVLAFGIGIIISTIACFRLSGSLATPQATNS